MDWRLSLFETWRRVKVFPRKPLPLYLDYSPTFGDFDREALRSLIRSVARPGCKMLEVGSWLGTGSTQVFIEELKPLGGVLYCVDTWKGSSSVESHQEFSHSFDLLASFQFNVRLQNAKKMVRPLVRSSLAAADELKDIRFDLIFLDGDHSYQAVSEDIVAWKPKVRPGGILCGHDCETRVTGANIQKYAEARERDYVLGEGTPFEVNHPGVILAVDEFFKGAAHLWAEEIIVLSNGASGPGTIWDICVGPDSSPGLR